MKVDLSPAALARIAPGLTLVTLGRLAEPPMHAPHLSRIAAGSAVTETTRLRIVRALERAAELAAAASLPPPGKPGRRRVTIC